ncbi:Glutathione synthase/RimK-type ligase-like ATP-grasp enzyme OS=Streptomyces albaduncus OX=68172 GN=FHS32_000547 PE=4 SV=1 [Streptomyces griseoloalbus]
MRVALVTCADGPDVAEDRDLPVLVRALNDAGAQASAEVWDDDRVDWARLTSP